MSRNSGLVLPGVIFLVLAVFAVSAFAQPAQPNAFYGFVTINGNPAPSGLLVVAKINGADVAATTTLEGKYGKFNNSGEFFYVEDPYSNRAGKTVEFFVSGIKGGEAVYQNGEVTRLDLSVTGVICGDNVCSGGESCSSCSVDCGSCPAPQGDGGGPGPGGGPAPCTEKWTCTDWFECVNGKQEKLCVDDNKCGTTKSKPNLTQSCVVAALPGCTPGELTCEGDVLKGCTPERKLVDVETCEYGCADGRCKPKPAAGNETGITQQPGGNPLADFFNNLFAGLFGGAGVTGLVTGSQLASLLGLLIIVIIIIIIAVAVKSRNGKKKGEGYKPRVVKS